MHIRRSAHAFISDERVAPDVMIVISTADVNVSHISYTQLEDTMQWFLNLKVGTKLIAGFVFVALIAAVVGTIGIVNMKAIDESDTQLYTNLTVPIAQIGEISTAFQRMRSNLVEAAVAKNAQEVESQKTKILARREEISKLAAAFEKTILSDEVRDAFKTYKDTRLLFNPIADRILVLAAQGKNAEAMAIWTGEAEQARVKYQAAITALVDLKTRQAGAKSEANTALANSATTQMIVFIVLGLVLAIGIGIMVARMITKPLGEALESANRVSEGDMTVELKSHSKDEVGQLIDALSNMVKRISDVIEEVMVSADNVASGSQELSATSEQMSQGATEQAAAAEEASSSTEEMVSNIRQNADNAHQTDGIATRSAQDAKVGGASVHQTVDAMKKIASKISIIEEIARQTNLLALNAAIEAARAGEHGKGFAVVASEVRKLAERSQTAAGEINQLASSSVEIAVQAGEMLVKLVPDIQKTAELVQEISSASAEQSTGVAQINKAIQQLDQVIQQNASASEEMSATSEELAAQAEQLKSAISFFKLKNIGHSREQVSHHAPPARGSFVAKKQLQKPALRKQTPAAPSSAKGAYVVLDEPNHNHHDDAEFEKY
jgi:methyl-accepting chemotaxis protein